MNILQKALDFWESGERQAGIRTLQAYPNKDLPVLRTLSAWLVDEDMIDEAVEYLKRAAHEFKDLESLKSLISLYSPSSPTYSDPDQYISYLSMGRMMKDEESIILLFKLKYESMVEDHGEDYIPLEDDDVYIITKEAAESRSPHAMRFLADWSIFKTPSTVEEDDDGNDEQPSTLELYLKAAQGGDYPSYFLAGLILLEGQNCKRDTKRALELFITGSRMVSSATSLGAIGNCFFTGMEDLQPQEERAVKLWRESANLGDLESQKKLADCYWQGLGVEVNRDEAKLLYRSCVKNNHLPAFVGLARCHFLMTPPNKEKARRLMRCFIQGVAASNGEELELLDDSTIDRILNEL